ncbi:hypothetical protein VTK73DRAFT_7433 [Phialemonium thermophilum]|uniref:Uncharacterized protein n=1 Tax=Phialemonium thermophilum TaxID=223376 RepID=A0ABR3WEJ0_9PEZI
MASLLSYIPVVNRLIPAGDDQKPAINVAPVEVHDVETAPERRPRTLKHLLRANHVNHAILYHNLEFDNHMAHILCSAYLLGASAEQLHHIYDTEAAFLEPWQDSPQEIVEDDWRDFLGDKRYQRAYVDFFEDALASRASYYEWKKVMEKYMFHGKNPLVNGLIGGLGHPLIHLGYAYEMNNKEIAIEALALAATQYNFLHKYIDDPSYTQPSPIGHASPAELLDKLSADSRFDGLFTEPGFKNIQPAFERHEALLLEYWNAWRPDLAAAAGDATKQFEQSQEAAAALLVATVPPGTHAYNFFFVHALTTSHAVRILLPVLPPQFRFGLVRAWWLLVLAVYVAELRPRIDPDYVSLDVGGKTWAYVVERGLNSEWATDAHYVKAIRALKEAANTWGDVHERYLASAVRFVDDFRGWTR